MLYLSGTTYKIGKAAYKVNAINNNNFTDAQTGGGYCASNKNYQARVTLGDLGLQIGDKPISLLIKSVNDDSSFAVLSESKDFPIQGKKISSTGTTTAGVARKINVLQGYQSYPSIFDYTLFTN